MLHKAWNSNGEIPYWFPRSSIKFQGHTGQNITDFDPNWAFPEYRPVAAFKSLRFALLWSTYEMTEEFNFYHLWIRLHLFNLYIVPDAKIWFRSNDLCTPLYLLTYANFDMFKFRQVIINQIFRVGGWCISYEVACRRISLDFTDDKRTLFQMKACGCRQQAIT